MQLWVRAFVELRRGAELLAVGGGADAPRAHDDVAVEAVEDAVSEEICAALDRDRQRMHLAPSQRGLQEETPRTTLSSVPTQACCQSRLNAHV